MNYLHREFDADDDDIIEVSLDGQANVLLLDGVNFEKYRKGESYHYHGGLAKDSPFRLTPPHQGKWHLVVDLGGFSGSVKAEVRMFKGVIVSR